MHNGSKDPLARINFAELYREARQHSGYSPKQSTDWDQRAGDFAGTRIRTSRYNLEFIRRMDLSGARTLLDVGCGAGNLVLPLAERLEKVYAIDYSPGMLAALEETAKERGLANIETRLCSWEENWEGLPEVDVVIASRSLEVEDLQAALAKMNGRSRRRCYLTYKVGGTFVAEEVLQVIGREVQPKPDYIYVVNILYQMGIRATVDFFESERPRFAFDNVQEFIRRVGWSLGGLTPEERHRLEVHLEALPPDASGSFEDRRPMVWAFLGWETTPEPLRPLRTAR